MSANFDDTAIFPTGISFGSKATRMRKTLIVIKGSGAENRTARWADSRRKYDLGYGVKSMDDLAVVIDFFEAFNACLIGFRALDWSDFQSCPPLQKPSGADQLIGVGDGVTTVFPLSKTYGAGTRTYTKAIVKIIAGSVLVQVGGSPVTPSSIDYNKGLVTLGSAPAASVLVTAGFQYHVPIRLDTDELTLSMDLARAGKFQSIPAIELFPGELV